MNTILEKISTEIIEFNPFMAQLVELEKEYGTRVYDLTDPVQDKAARSDRLRVAKVISAFEDVRKAAKADAQERVKHVDGLGKIIRDRMEAVRDSIKDQLDARDAEIAAHAIMLQEKVDAIRAFDIPPDVILSAQNIQNRIDELSKVRIDIDIYEDRNADAALALMETKMHLDFLLNARKQFESEQDELNKLRKEKEDRERAEREEQIRQEATLAAEAKAKQEAENARIAQERQAEAAEARIKAAEAQAKAIEETAKRKAQDAAESAKKAQAEAVALAEQAERNRIGVELVATKAKEEADRKADEARTAKKSHRAKVEKEAIQSFVDAFHIPDTDAKDVIEAIRDGKIAHVTLNY